MKLLDPVELSRISNLRLKVNLVVEGVLAGLHSSPYRGHSQEFAQHREYAPGDDPRYLDWKILGRTEKLFLKQFQDETNLRAHILLDSSASMGFKGSSGISKLDFGKLVAASLTYLLLRQEDAVSVSAFAEKLSFYIPPRHQLSHMPLIFEKLETLSPGDETSFVSVLRDFGKHIKKRSLLVIICDLMGDAGEIIKALKYYKFRHHEVMVFHVLNRGELDFAYSGETVFRDLESAAELFCDADEIADSYRKIVSAFVETFKSAFRKSGITYNLCLTDSAVETLLARILKQ